jgi:glutathione peroxidase
MLLDIPLKLIDGSIDNLLNYQNKVLLVVNVASECGFTSQYRGLELLYRDFKDQGFEILAFPCNQFGNQEPGDSDQIANFCKTNYQVTFPLFQKIEVNGMGTHPLFDLLKNSAPGLLGSTTIKWNFTKFLINRAGEVIERFAPTSAPVSIGRTIRELL